MKVITPNDQLPTTWKRSIFLAGPTTRNNEKDITEWREEACKILKSKKFDGVVFVPEPFIKNGYEAQIDWENECLNMADCILFWIPRSKELPGFTTNVEYGDWMKSGKVVLGIPPHAERSDYLKYKAKKYVIPTSNSLEDTIDNALKYMGEGAIRKDGERYVPMQIWRTNQFQSWYKSLQKAENELTSARVEWAFRVGKDKTKVFCWVLHVDVYITEEKRSKTNEFVFARTDITSVVAYRPTEKTMDTEILIVKEFRSPCSNESGYIYELPSGSSKDDNQDMAEVVTCELREETGLRVNKDRFEKVEVRQVAGTLSSHKSSLFRVELKEEEVKQLKETKREYGQEDETERTYVIVKTLKEILSEDLLDWANIGMIFQALAMKKEKGKDAADWVGAFLK